MIIAKGIWIMGKQQKVSLSLARIMLNIEGTKYSRQVLVEGLAIFILLLASFVWAGALENIVNRRRRSSAYCPIEGVHASPECFQRIFWQMRCIVSTRKIWQIRRFGLLDPYNDPVYWEMDREGTQRIKLSRKTIGCIPPAIFQYIQGRETCNYVQSMLLGLLSLSIKTK